jgi:hypothetical protein
MKLDKDHEEFIELCKKPWDRLNSLYYIISKRGNRLLFRCNWAQKELYDNLWYCNIVLKARQLGISTFICMLFLDRCLFNDNVAAGIICHTREDAELMFKRVKYAYDNLPKFITCSITATIDSARELVFNNGSSIRVGTSMRGSTLQYLHISEFGKICAKYPEKATEIITGSLNTLAAGQYCFIESTAEGREGYFYEMCKKAQDDLKAEKDLSPLDFKFHFYPWWREPSYRIGSPIVLSQESLEYFSSLEDRGITLTAEQKYWYAAKYNTQSDEMLREFPSTPQEAFEVANEGLYYGRLISLARLEKRIGFVPYDRDLPVYTAWDLGYNDSTAIVFFQVLNKEIRIIDYLEGSGESLSYWLGLVKSKPYVYDKHLAPHDIMNHEYSTGMTRQAFGRKMGINLIPVPKTGVIEGIDMVRNILHRCWFDEKKAAGVIVALDNYKKEWDDKHGCWRSSPLHNQYSHGADAFRYLVCGLSYITRNDKIDGSTIGGGSITANLRQSVFG